MLSRRGFVVSVVVVTPILACGRQRDAQPRGDATDRPASDPEPLAPASASAPAPAAAELAELDPALAARIQALHQQFAGRGFTILAEPPFAVVGDGSSEQVKAYAERIVRWAVHHLEAAYFEESPAPVVTIFLFETAESYARNAHALFGEGPDTPYGYYSRADNALVMNIATGGGTLVHEIVHPYIEANFAACPTWFDEGLASLYEQSAERGGTIVGLTNWRLAGLQDALRAGRVPSFADLCASGLDFYTVDPAGTNYAQARYLCYWLQEQGVLRRYYREFRAKLGVDPTGYDTLVRMVGPDMDAFRARWETFVMGLRYP